MNRRELFSCWFRGWIALAVMLATLVVLSPVLRNQFVDWDDPFTLVQNPYYRGLGWTQVQWMFGKQSLIYGGHYTPISWLFFGLDYALWGMDPRGYHLTSLLLHAINAALVYFLCRRLVVVAAGSVSNSLRLDLAAAFAALFFALHPLRVEPLAWASDRIDIICGTFYLLAVLCYLRAVSGSTERNGGWHLLAISSFALSLLTKEAGVTLPFVLVVLDIYPLRRLSAEPKRWLDRDFRHIWLEKAPFLVLSCAAGVIGLYGAAQAHVLQSLEKADFLARVSLSAFGTAFYLWKTVVPFKLLPLYALPVPFNPFQWESVLGGTVVIALTVVFYRCRRRFPAGFAAWAAYLLTLLPAMGFTGKGEQMAADRYSYLPCIALAIVAGSALLRSQTAEKLRFRRTLTKTMPLLILVTVGGLSWRQTKVWRDSETLWKYVLSVDPKCAAAHNNLGFRLAENRRFDEAIQHYREALRANPDFHSAHNNLAFALAKQGKLRAAIAHWRALLRIQPDNARALNNLGFFLAQRGELAEAILHYNRALRVDPSFSWPHINLCLALSQLGRLSEALAYCRRGVELSPDDYTAHVSFGWSLGLQGRFDEAIAQYKEALRVMPRSAEAHARWANICVAKGQLGEAAAHYRAALKLDPNYVEPYYNLVAIYRRRGDNARASQYLEIMKRKGLPIPDVLIRYDLTPEN